MPLKQGLHVILASDGGSPELLLQQTPVDSLTNDSPGPSWASVGGSTLFTAAGAAIAMNAAKKTELTSIFQVSAGLVAGTGRLVVNVSVLNASTVKTDVMNTFVTGGRIEIPVGGATLKVELRALRSIDFLLGEELDGAMVPTGRGALEPVAIVGQNFQVPAAETPDDYAFTYSNAAAPGIFSLTADEVTGTTVLLASGDAAPPGEAPGRSSLAIAREFTAYSTGAAVAAYTVTSTIPARIHVPTEFVLSYDRSSSMNKPVGSGGTLVSKWQAALSVANMMSRLFAVVASPKGAISATNKIILEQWTFKSGATNVNTMPIGGFGNGDTAPQLNAPPRAGGRTPIADALVHAAANFTSSRWRRRAIILLTDGLHNAGTLALNSTDLTDAVFPASATAPLSDKITLHLIEYLVGGGTFNTFLTTRQAVTGGQLHNSAADPNPLSSDNLFDMFANVLQSLLAVDCSNPFGVGSSPVGSTFPVEPGVDRVVFLATVQGGVLGALTVTSPSGVVVQSPHPANHQNGFSWVVVDSPESGNWTLTAHPGGALYVFYDHTLFFRSGAQPALLGAPIKLWADLRWNAQPVRGADVRLGSRRPAESIGDVLTRFVQGGGLTRAITRGTLSREVLLDLLGVAAGQKAGADQQQDVPSLQAELLKAAEADRNLPLQYSGHADRFAEVSPGRYELTVPASLTANENVRNFYIKADGNLPGGAAFARSSRFSVQLDPLPAAAKSTVMMLASAPHQGLVTWTANTIPRTVTGNTLGPGLSHYLVYRYVDRRQREQLAPLVTLDNIDGSYSTQLSLKDGQKPPAIALYAATARDGEQLGIIPVDAGTPCADAVRVVVRLHQLQVLDDKDLFGSGELVFQAAVGVNGSPTRTVRTRLPVSGHYQVKSGEVLDLDEVIFEGLVEKNARLVIGITGEDLDWPTCFDHSDKLARYVRSVAVPEKTKKYDPDDETNDPESLADWKLWYSIEIA